MVSQELLVNQIHYISGVEFGTDIFKVNKSNQNERKPDWKCWLCEQWQFDKIATLKFIYVHVADSDTTKISFQKEAN